MAATPQQIVEALDDALLKSAQTGFPLSYSINGRSITFHNLDSIRRLRAEYAALANLSRGSARTRVSFGGGPP